MCICCRVFKWYKDSIVRCSYDKWLTLNSVPVMCKASAVQVSGDGEF